MKLLRSMAHAAGQTASRLVLGLINVKLAAVFLGPAGVGLYGQFWSLVGLISGPLVAPISTVLTREVARSPETERQQSLIGQTLRLSFLLGLAVTLSIVPFAATLSEWLFFSADYALEVILVSAALLPVFFNTTMIAAARGRKELASISVSELLVASAGTLTVAIMIPIWGLRGAFWSVAAAPFAAALFLLIQYRSRPWFAKLLGVVGDPTFKRDFLRFFGSSLITASTVAVAPILIRNGIAARLSIDHVGYWQAGTRMSDLYFSVFATLLALHYLPRFSEIRHGSEILGELRRGAMILGPLVSCGALLIFLLLDPLVRLLYTAQFLPLEQIMGWQLAGVVLQGAAWYVRYVMVAQGMVWWIAATEVGLTAFWVLLSLTLLPEFGLAGVSMAYFTRYLIDLLYSSWKCRQVIRSMHGN